MNQHQLPSHIVGLAKVVPPLSRRGFVSSSAAVAAGYTLAASPVRADVIHILIPTRPKLARRLSAPRFHPRHT
jgi:DNA-binding IscR family transcriptional regulator